MMIGRGLAVAAALLATAPATASAQQRPLPALTVDPGPAPDFARIRADAEARLKAGLYDPGSAQVEWPYGWQSGYWKPVLKARKVGWYTCGRINAKNRMGGYVGFRSFVVVAYRGQIIFAETDGEYGVVAASCRKGVDLGLLAPAASTADEPAASAAAGAGYGLDVMAVPEGLYVRAVAPGSASAGAGLQPGMVISHINRIALKPLGDGAGRPLAATDGAATLTVIGRGEVTLAGPAAR